DPATTVRDLRVDGRCVPEQAERLIDHVRPEVVEDATAILDGDSLAPLVVVLGAVALVPALEARWSADGTGGDHLADGEEVAIPARIVEYGQQPPRPFGGRDDGSRLASVARERLVDDDMQAVRQRSLGQARMRRIWRCYDDGVELRCAREQRLWIRDDHR